MLFTQKFYQTLVFNVATVSAIVVGIFQFAVRAFNENNGAEKVRKVVNKTLFYINKLTAKVYEATNADTLPPVKNNKRRAAAA